MTTKYEAPLPLPRLMHIQSGQSFTLRNGELHQLLDKCNLYGYIHSGKIGLSAVLDSDTMVFDCDGWRLECQP